MTKSETVPAARADLPSQEGWARRAGEIRNPVTSFIFGIQTRANAKALNAEGERVKAARGVLKEYTGMYDDMRAGQDAANSYGVRRDLAGEHYEHERAKQQETFDEQTHRRRVAEKRREKELIEADTRRIEAAHEQEATVKFKDEKFQVGFARYKAKTQEHLVGAASAEAAIAETTAAKPADSGANENREVGALYALLQAKMRAVEEGERLGQDTQALRQQVELYKTLLNLT